MPGISSNAAKGYGFLSCDYLIDISYIMFIIYITHIDLLKGGD